MNLFTSTNGSFSLCGRNNRTGTGKSSNTQILNQQQVNSAMLDDKHYPNTSLKNNSEHVKKAPELALLANEAANVLRDFPRTMILRFQKNQPFCTL